MHLHAHRSLAREWLLSWWCRAGWSFLFCLGLSGCAGITLNAVQDGRLVADGPIPGVEVIRQGARPQAQPDMALEPGDEVRTGPQTSVVLSFLDGARVFVQPSTHVRIGSICVYLGEVLIKFKGFFQVETKYATAGSEGTQYLVRVDPGDQVRVVVAEDRVGLLSRSQRWSKIILGPGQSARIIGADPPRVDEKGASPEEIEDIRQRIRELDAVVPEYSSIGPLLGGALAIGAGIGIGQMLKDKHKDQPDGGSYDGRQPGGGDYTPPGMRRPPAN